MTVLAQRATHQPGGENQQRFGNALRRHEHHERHDVHAELGEVVAGRKPGRCSSEETIVFDSTGMALQDVAAAAAVYERAVQAGRGLAMSLGE